MSGYEIYYIYVEVVAYLTAVGAFFLWLSRLPPGPIDTAPALPTCFWISLGVAIVMPVFRAIIRLAKPK